MKIALYVGVVIAIIIVWSLYGYFTSHVEQTPYTVTKKTDTYEIRQYPSHLVAQTTVSGSYKDSLNEGFSIVAGYIFGANIQKQKIAMTSPVVATDEGSEKIAMTAPVLATDDQGSTTIAFGMPQSYTEETLPTPTDSRVRVVRVPETTFAVITSTGYRTDARLKRMETTLREALVQDGVQANGKVSYAGYNAPGTPPWMTRNEILIELK